MKTNLHSARVRLNKTFLWLFSKQRHANEMQRIYWFSSCAENNGRELGYTCMHEDDSGMEILCINSQCVRTVLAVHVQQLYFVHSMMLSKSRLDANLNSAGIDWVEIMQSIWWCSRKEADSHLYVMINKDSNRKLIYSFALCVDWAMFTIKSNV